MVYAEDYTLDYNWSFPQGYKQPVEKPVEKVYIFKCVNKCSWELCMPRMFYEMCRVVAVLARQVSKVKEISESLEIHKFDFFQNPWYYKNCKTSENSVISKF